MITHKMCPTCKILLSAEAFHKNKRHKDGLASECKLCCSVRNKKYYSENKEYLSNKCKLYYEENKEEIKENARNYYDSNKANILERAKQYKEERKDEISAQNKVYATENKECISVYQKEYYQTNKIKLRKKQNEREAFRMKKDPSFKIRKMISLSIRAGLKKNGTSKQGKSILQYLLYTIQQLRDYLEAQFEPWMTWENWGKYNATTWDNNDPATWTWQLDHIVPQALFYYTSMEDRAFRDCWALSNLRPYSAKQNWLDGINRSRHNLI